MSMNELNFTVFDFETSGLDPNHDHIIEACVIRVRDGKPVSVYNTLVQMPEGKALAENITALTGHTKDDLANGITQEHLAYILWELFDMPNDEPEVLVAYNALFDMSFLEALFKRHGVSHRGEAFTLPNPFIDPLTIARNRDPYPHKLGDSCRRHNIPFEDAHSAYNDTFALLDLVLEQHKKGSLGEWLNVAGYRPKYGEPSWYPKHAKLVKQGAEVIEHSKKPVVRPKVKPRTVVTRNQTKRKKAVPDDPQAFEKLMPSGLLPADTKRLIDEFLSTNKEGVDILQLNVMVLDEDTREFNSIMDYLTKVKNVPEHLVSSYFDNPAEAVIEVYRDTIPF